MNQFNINDFQRYVVRQLETLNEDIFINNPDEKQKFPLGVVSNAMENVILTNESNLPIKKTFNITIEWWTDSKYTSMEKYVNCTNKLAQSNILQMSSNIDRYDDITRKYIYGASYEVNYNGITNSFEKIK